MSHRLTQEEFAARVEEVHGGKYAVKGSFEGRKKRVLVECSCGHKWMPVADELLRGRGCDPCGHKAHRKSHGEFLEDVQKVHGGKVVVDGIYETSQKRVDVHCSICGRKWNPVPERLLRGDGCRQCVCRLKAAQQTKTHEKFREEMRAVHKGNIEAITRYEHWGKKMVFKCLVCQHEWVAIPQSIRAGCGCPKCAGVYRRTHEEFLEDVNKKHGDAIIVVGTFKGCLERIAVRCRDCAHEWSPFATKLLQGSGCPQCSEGGFKMDDPGICYYVRVDNPSGAPLYKIGITNRTVRERFKPEMVDVAIVDIKSFAIGADAYAFEQQLLTKHAHHRYRGPRVFRWSGNDELFTRDVLGLDKGERQLNLFCKEEQCVA